MEEDKKIEQVESDESLDEVEEEIDEAEEEVEKDEPQKKQSRNANRKFAELRKENERLEKRIAELEEYNKRAKLDTSKKFISEEAKKDLGIDDISSEEDLALFEEYEKARLSGSENPSRDAYATLRHKALNKQVEETKVNENNKKLAKEYGERLIRIYGITPTDVFNNQEFIEKFGSEVKHGNLTELYGAYLYQKSKSEINKGNSVPPTSSNSNKKGSNDLSKIDSDEEFLAEFNKKYKH